MTNEQAIAELQKERDLIQGEHDLDGSQFAPALLEALAMAIEALKAQDMTLHMNLPEASAEEVVEILKRNNRIELLPSAQPERWDTCFSCPLSHGCPVINGCTNDQAEQYAGEIPADCPLDKESAQPERKKGTYTESGDDDEWYCRYATCNECGKEWMGSRNFCPNCGVAMRGEVNENQNS